MQRQLQARAFIKYFQRKKHLRKKVSFRKIILRSTKVTLTVKIEMQKYFFFPFLFSIFFYPEELFLCEGNTKHL